MAKGMRWDNALRRVDTENVGLFRSPYNLCGCCGLAAVRDIVAERLDMSLHNPSVHDCHAMRVAAKRKLATCNNTRNLFHRLCLLHRLNRRHNGHWHAAEALAELKRAR
jgi:hypothetical protein